MDINQAVSMMQGMATTPEQQNMVQWLTTQPKEVVVPVLRQYMQQIPLESVPGMLQQVRYLTRYGPSEGTKAHKEVTNWHVNGGIQKKPPAQTMPKTRCPTCGK